MRRAIFAVVSFVAALSFTQRHAPAQTGVFGDCKPAALGAYSKVADDTVVATCTKLIRSGTLNTQDLAEAYNRRGIAYDHLGQLASAIADYNEALRLDPDNGNASNNRGLIFKEQKRYALAIADFTHAMKTLGGPLPYANRALTYWEMGNFEQAEIDFAQAIVSGGSYNLYNYTSRAGVFSAMGRHADAIAQLGEVIDRLHGLRADRLRILQPDKGGYATAFYDRCFERGILGDLRSALSDCAESLSLQPGDPEALYSKAFVEFKLGRFKDAIRDENAALSGTREAAGAYYLRGLAERHLGRTIEAASDLRSAAKLEPRIADAFLHDGIRPDGTLTHARDFSKFCRNGYKDPIVRC